MITKIANTLQDHISACGELCTLLTRHRQLTWEMTKRELSGRYVGQVFGVLWVIGHPLVLMAVYVFIFAYVLKIRIADAGDLPFNYTVYLLSGLIPWMAFQESMQKGTVVIVSNANLVKQVVFPLDVLPVKGVIASFLTQLIYTVFFIVYAGIQYQGLPIFYLWSLVLFFFQILAMMGVSYLLSAFGVYFRDLKDLVQVFCVVGVYLMPIFYLPSQVPSVFQPLLYLNPFSYLGWCYQDVFYFCRFAHPWAWGVFMGMSVVVFYGGYRVFRKLKRYFGSVL